MTSDETYIDLAPIRDLDDRVIEAILYAAKVARVEGKSIILNRPPHRLVEKILDAHEEDRFVLRIQSIAKDRERRSGLAVAIRRGFPILVPASLGATMLVRDLAAQLSQEIGFDEADLADIELCVGEAAVNAVRHGCTDSGRKRFVVRFFQDSDKIAVEIHDDGEGFKSEQVPMPHAEQMREGGLGIFLMRTLMDRVDFDTTNGTTVFMEKRVC